MKMVNCGFVLQVLIYSRRCRLQSLWSETRYSIRTR